MPATGPPGKHNAGPALSVQAAFGQNPLAGTAASYTWTDISSYVLSYSSRGGRQHELDRFESRTAQILLDNTDGRFSPYNTSSPYTGNIVPSTPIWVQAVYSGASYSRFFGYADDWTMQWVGTGYSNVQLNCTDGLGLLSLFEFGLATSAYANLVKTDGGANLKQYWRCGDAPGSTTVSDSSGNGNYGLIDYGPAGGATFGFPGAFVYDPNTSIDLTNGTNAANAGIIGGFSGASPPASIEAWFQATGASVQAGVGNGAMLASGATGGSVLPDGAVIWVTNTTAGIGPTVPEVNFALIGSASVGIFAPVLDGKWHHVVITVDSSHVWELYVDGQGSFTFTHTPSGPTEWLFASYWGMQNPTSPFGPFTSWPGAVQDIAYYSTALTSAQVLNHYNTGILFRNNELSGQRVQDCLTASGIPTGAASIATGIATCAAETSPIVGTKTLDYIGTVCDTEPSAFWQDSFGRFIFTDRYFTLTAASSVFVFSDDPSVPGVYYELGFPNLTSDALDLWPTVTVTRNNGTIQTATNSSNLARYGPRQDNVSGVLYTADSYSLSLATWYATIYGKPMQRVTGVTTSLYGTDGSASVGGSHVAGLLGLTFLQRVTVRKKMLDGGAAYQQDACIEAITETVTGGPNSHWTLEFALSPYDLAGQTTVALWDSATQGIWNTNLWGL